MMDLSFATNIASAVIAGNRSFNVEVVEPAIIYLLDVRLSR
jgi:hypothetical protein